MRWEQHTKISVAAQQQYTIWLIANPRNCLLGYWEVSSFAYAFKRWTGNTYASKRHRTKKKGRSCTGGLKSLGG